MAMPICRQKLPEDLLQCKLGVVSSLPSARIIVKDETMDHDGP